MGIIYYFLSTLDSVNCERSPQIHPWEYTKWLLPAEREVLRLEESIIVQRSLHDDVMLFFDRVFNRWILLEGIYNKYIRDGSSISTIVSFWKLWKWPLSKLTMDMLPVLAKHQATISTLTFYKYLASLFCSDITLLKLSQHPYHRVKSIAQKDSSPLSLAASAFVITVWSNALYYLADLTVRQVSKATSWAVARIMDTEAKEEPLESSWVKCSWDTTYRQSLRLWYSSLGSAMGSMILPGFGTLAGIGLGEQWADRQEIPSPPESLLKAIPRLEKCFVASPKTKEGPMPELLCSSCKTHYFTSDPNHPTHAPISSRTCEHTICRSCVDLKQRADLEFSGASDVASSDQLTACPICGAPAAFSPHDLLVNQSLCRVISLVYQKAGLEEPLPSMEIDMRRLLEQRVLQLVTENSGQLVTENSENSPSEYDPSSQSDFALSSTHSSSEYSQSSRNSSSDFDLYSKTSSDGERQSRVTFAKEIPFEKPVPDDDEVDILSV